MDIVSKMKVGASRCKKRWQLFIFMVLLMAYIIIFKYTNVRCANRIRISPRQPALPEANGWASNIS